MASGRVPVTGASDRNGEGRHLRLVRCDHVSVDLRDSRYQAIAKAGGSEGNGVRLVRAPSLCLCKASEQEGLAARTAAE